VLAAATTSGSIRAEARMMPADVAVDPAPDGVFGGLSLGLVPLLESNC
jgi:hypothetical protein